MIVSALAGPAHPARVAAEHPRGGTGIRPGDGTLRFRFVARPDGAPAAGYTLISRDFPEGVPHELGMTDRGGRIALAPKFAEGLVILRLLAGNAEPMVEFPVMPGESSDEREIPIDPKPLTVTYQVQLDALRDEVIDLVAQRARLEKRMEARLQGEDLASLEQNLKEYALLPRKDVYSRRLEELKDRAAKQQAETKTAVLTKNIQARFNELQALIDRYLNDEPLANYTEALDRKKAEIAEAAKVKAGAKAARPARDPAGAAPGPDAGKTPARPAAPAGKDAAAPTQPF
ncbi:MAG: hypothetical protein U0790_03525 [Isosphaeraceae bacterium]